MTLTQIAWRVRIKNRETKRWRTWPDPCFSEESAKRFCGRLLSPDGEAAEVEVLKETLLTEVTHSEKRGG